MTVPQVMRLFALVGVLLLGFGLAEGGLARYPITTDEMYSLIHFGVLSPPHSLSEVSVSLASKSPDHLPLYFWLGAVWARLVGYSELGLRALSLLWGALLIACVYRLGAAMRGFRLGFCAALLMSTSAFALIYFAVARMYPLLMCLAALNFWGYWRIAREKRDSWRGVVFLALTTAGMLSVHGLSFIWLGSLGACHLVFLEKSRRWLRPLMGWLLGGLIFLPLLPAFIRGLRYTDARSAVLTNTASLNEILYAFLDVMFNGAPWLVLVCAILLLLALRRRREKLPLVLAFVFALQLLAIVALDSWTDTLWISRMRYLLLLWIPGLLLVACCVTALPRWKRITLVFTLLWMGAGWQFAQSERVFRYSGGIGADLPYPPMQRIVPLLRERTRPHDYILGLAHRDFIDPSSRMGLSLADLYLGSLLHADGVFLRDQLTGEELLNAVDASLGAYPEFWLVYDSIRHAQSAAAIIQRKSDGYRSCGQPIAASGWIAQRFALRIVPCQREYAPIAYENGIRIVDHFARYDAEAQLVQAATAWEVDDEALLRQFNLSLQIIAPDWRKAAQAGDRHLYDGILKWHAVEMSTRALPPGDYRLVVIVYDRYTGDKVSGANLTSGEASSIQTILPFTITY